MIILSHRGYWKTAAEKNTSPAFERSFALGFGTETDLRDSAGQLVVSHDPPTAKALPADEMLRLHQRIAPDVPLALNIKADGLQGLVEQHLQAFGVRDYFLFDMAVPDAVGYLRKGMQVFTRHSELESEPAYYQQACGVWVDAFAEDWITPSAVTAHLEAGKRVCVVSPELHGRDRLGLWQRLRDVPAPPGRLLLYTDHPEEAKSFFHG